MYIFLYCTNVYMSIFLSVCVYLFTSVCVCIWSTSLDVCFPLQGDVRDMISDLDVCMAWVLREINAYGGDPENIHLIGHSSGAHLTSLLLVFHLCRLAEVCVQRGALLSALCVG